MSFESALTFFIAIFIFGITPGPGVFAILARGMMFGTRSCLPLSVGMIASDIIYLILACLGLAAVAEHWGGLFTVIRYAGAAYLLYLGYKMFTSKPDLSQQDNGGSEQGIVAGFIQGFLISASNPKVILFYIAFLPTFMDLTVLTARDIGLAAVLTFFALLAGLMLIAAFAAWASKMLRSERSVNRLNKSAGGIMMSAGAYLALKS